MARDNIICVVGPTASGKTALAVELADPIVQDILSRGKTVIIAGGTGLYVDNLIKGGEFAPTPSTGCRERLEARLQSEGIKALAAELEKIDPVALEKSQGNPRRILRALEVYMETGETITAHNQRTAAIPPRFDPVWIGIDFASRQELYDRIDLRVELMVKDGLLDEIREVLASGIPEKATAMQAIGYKEFIDAMAGRSTIEEAIAQVQQSSRRYAKRQLTWFRRNEKIGRASCRERV